MDADLENLAWAAGFIDGDGTITCNGKRYVAIHAGNVDPELLVRLRRILGCGNVSGPYDRRGSPDRWSLRPQYSFQAYAGAEEAVAKMWFMLGNGKRNDALAALSEIFGAPTDISERPRWTIAKSGMHQAGEDSFRLVLAWAAGFFDAEGCFSTTARVGTSVSITQTDREILDRFQRVVGFGKVYGPYQAKTFDRFPRKPHYFYKAHGRERVQALLAMLWTWLGSAKKQQAIDRLDWPTACLRGHPKKLGHTGCGECTRAYWEAFRSIRREPGVGESEVPYLLAG